MKVLLITPPFTQFNSPYPAISYLASYLSQQNYYPTQRDFSLELILKIFSFKGLIAIKKICEKIPIENQSSSIVFFLDAFDQYLGAITPVMEFLKNQDPVVALRIVNGQLLPEGPRFTVLEDQKKILKKMFGDIGTQDKAKYLASLYLDDLNDVICQGVDLLFQLSRYGEKLAASQADFSPLYEYIKNSQTLIDDFLTELVEEVLSQGEFNLLLMTVPFPGNFPLALKIAQLVKARAPKTSIAIGGGFINTELRECEDIRIFEFVDFILFDEGARPLQCLMEFLEGKRKKDQLFRTWFLENKSIIKTSLVNEHDIPFKNLPPPDYSGLKLKDYFSMMEMPNIVHRLWSDYKWNKLILAHGCYWKKCTFCDITLDYISRFEPAPASTLVDAMEKIFQQTGSRGFHFVDEAAPPTLLKSLSEELIKRDLKFAWWGNLRFDQYFDEEVASLMAYAGCVAVTGGLEVASPRILELMQKGIKIEQVAKVMSAFSKSGILVHAYLMYGFPGQTAQETIDSLEIVRQLFDLKLLKSAHWHRFSVTAHSPIGKNPTQYGLTIFEKEIPPTGLFARNDLDFEDIIKVDHDALGLGLKKALYNYMLGVGVDFELKEWFEIKVPKTSISPQYLQHSLKPRDHKKK